MGVGEVKCGGYGHPRLRISSVRPQGLGRQKGQRVHREPPLPAHHKRPGLRGAQSPQSAKNCCASLLTLCPLSWGLSGSCSPSPKQCPPLKPQERVGPGRGRANLDPVLGPPSAHPFSCGQIEIGGKLWGIVVHCCTFIALVELHIFCRVQVKKQCALFTTSRTCTSADEWIRKLWYTGTMEYYSAMKRNAFELSQFSNEVNEPGTYYTK